MPIITTFPGYLKQCKKLLKGNKKEVRISTYNIYTLETPTQLFLAKVFKRPHKILVGVSSSNIRSKRTLQSLSFLKKYGFNFKIREDLHLKYVSCNGKAIIGGINLTSSNFKDAAVIIKDDKVQELDTYFDTLWDQENKDDS